MGRSVAGLHKPDPTRLCGAFILSVAGALSVISERGASSTHDPIRGLIRSQNRPQVRGRELGGGIAALQSAEQHSAPRPDDPETVSGSTEGRAARALCAADNPSKWAGGPETISAGCADGTLTLASAPTNTEPTSASTMGQGHRCYRAHHRSGVGLAAAGGVRT
jgi:hypothetical protein